MEVLGKTRPNAFSAASTGRYPASGAILLLRAVRGSELSPQARGVAHRRLGDERGVQAHLGHRRFAVEDNARGGRELVRDPIVESLREAARHLRADLGCDVAETKSLPSE
jgi:hypothetical protein